MNYPVWELTFFGGGLTIALMAVFHVFISHFAVGGGLFLVLTEWYGYRRNSPEIVDYVRKHTRFFLLVTMVLGGMTGVGIWFVISLINPATTSILIHNFVFGWAIEWVFFVGEIVSLLIYYYTFGRMNRRHHLLLGWLYFIFAWLSLFVINGIIDFMLTPGDWLASGDFWDGFFNPSFWPSLFFRTFMALSLAGLYGFLTATAIKDEALRLRLVRYCALWLVAPFVFLFASSWWYVQVLSAPIRTMLLNQPDLLPFIQAFALAAPVLILGGLVMAIKIPGSARQGLAAVLMVAGLVHLGAFEYIREGSRRPYTIYDHIYSHSILKKEVPAVAEAGLLANAKWVEQRQINDENRSAAGRELFYLACAGCHSIGGPARDIIRLTKGYADSAALAARLSGLCDLVSAMPPFPGTTAEREALAAFIVEELQPRRAAAEGPVITPFRHEVPPFAPEASHLLTAWSESPALFSLRPSRVALNAMLIKRGPSPEVITTGVELSYRLEPGFGNGEAGLMQAVADGRTFRVGELPVQPYPQGGGYLPYPLVTVTARATESGEILATGKVVATVATDWGCRNCHGGGWRKQAAGLSPLTIGNILAAHDRYQRTGLAAKAEQGDPVQCAGCHADSGTLSLSAAIHGFHAPILQNRGADACYFCHQDADPDGATRAFRGIHQEVGLDCTNCHGVMEDHALSLLRAEAAAGKARAGQLIARLTPKAVERAAEIVPRRAWINQPDCLNCHQDFQPPAIFSTFNQWTPGEKELYRRRGDDLGLPCAACHGSVHALYPAVNAFDRERDNIGPRQLQGNPYPLGANRNCRLCHTREMDDEMHHPNSLTEFRNQR